MIFDYRCKGTKNYLYTQEKVQKKISGCYLSRALSSIHVPKLRFSREYSDVLALPIANTAFGLRWGPPMERRVWETTQTKSPGIEMISGLRKWRLPTLPRCNFRSPIGDAVCGRLCRLSAPRARERAHRTPHTVRHRRHRARLRSRLGDVKRRLDRPGHKRYGLSPFFRIKVESNENLSRRRPLFPLSGTTLRGFPFFERQRRRV